VSFGVCTDALTFSFFCGVISVVVPWDVFVAFAGVFSLALTLLAPSAEDSLVFCSFFVGPSCIGAVDCLAGVLIFSTLDVSFADSVVFSGATFGDFFEVLSVSLTRALVFLVSIGVFGVLEEDFSSFFSDLSGVGEFVDTAISSPPWIEVSVLAFFFDFSLLDGVISTSVGFSFGVSDDLLIVSFFFDFSLLGGASSTSGSSFGVSDDLLIVSFFFDFSLLGGVSIVSGSSFGASDDFFFFDFSLLCGASVSFVGVSGASLIVSFFFDFSLLDGVSIVSDSPSDSRDLCDLF
jgi:hypothetical protein